MIPAKILGCIIFFLLVTTVLYSQETEFIRGRLYDAQNGEPIPFATIRVKGRALGVISNLDGGFRVPKKFEELGDTLLISCMGYERQIFRLSGLSRSTSILFD